MRYHRDVYFPEWATIALTTASKRLNWKRTILSAHAIDKLYGEYAKLASKIKLALESVWFDQRDVFEFQGDETNVNKICYRLENFYKEMDLIVILNSNKVVITFYLNNRYDTHSKLDKSLYSNGD